MLKKLFDLEKEENLIFLEEENRNILSQKNSTIYLKAKTVQSNCKCDKCKSRNIVKNGTYISDILFNKIDRKKIILKLTKQRYKCKDCNSYFIPKLKFLNKRKRISNKIFQQIAIDSCLTLSNKEISRQNFVSANTVSIKQQEFNEYIMVNKKILPKVICVDEFRGVESYQGKMNFIIVDGEKHKIKDILITRQKYTLNQYFYSYSKEVKFKVDYFVCDMYDTYISIAKKHFPNAKIIIDRFHIKRLIANSLRNYRIKIMKKYKNYTLQYRILKRFRKLLMKNYNDIRIDFHNNKFYTNFDSEHDILMYMLSLDETLHDMYGIYQDFIEVFENKDTELFKELIYKNYVNITEDMKTTLFTYQKYEEYIINALIYPYSNGVVEGINGKIKLIKRIGFGYRNFKNFRLRILLIFNLLEIIEDTNRKEKRKKDYNKKSS